MLSKWFYNCVWLSTTGPHACVCAHKQRIQCLLKVKNATLCSRENRSLLAWSSSATEAFKAMTNWIVGLTERLPNAHCWKEKSFSTHSIRKSLQGQHLFLSESIYYFKTQSPKIPELKQQNHNAPKNIPLGIGEEWRGSCRRRGKVATTRTPN